MNSEKIFKAFAKKKILVIGDVMIDSYIWGKVDRLSPEAPVPVVKVDTRSSLLGGAANVALNIKSMGASPLLLSVIGNDPKGEDFIKMMKEQDLPVDGILRSSERITTTKFRVIGNNHQLIRVDEEIDSDLIESDALQLIERFELVLRRHKIDAIIFQDYNKGILSPEVISTIIDKASASGIPIAVDPKKRNFNLYTNVTLFKPNLKELLEGSKEDIEFEETNRFRDLIIAFQQKQNIHHILVTLSEKGVFISSKTGDGSYETYHIPAHLRKIADVSGAGDTVVSVASLCLAENMEPRQIAAISNLAGGLVCESVGVVPVDHQRLKTEIESL